MARSLVFLVASHLPHSFLFLFAPPSQLTPLIASMQPKMPCQGLSFPGKKDRRKFLNILPPLSRPSPAYWPPVGTHGTGVVQQYPQAIQSR